MTKFMQSPVILCIEIVFILFSLTKTSSKTFERCEFANILRYYYELDLDEVARWVCIAQEASGLNSDLRSLDSHGLFQINERSWCSPPGSGCNIECDKLRDDHITDDLACVKIIHAEHQRISGDGYTAWPVYQHSCHNQSFAYIENCFGNQLTSQYQGNTTENYRKDEKSKVYERCELARELYKEHNIPIEQVATWICIAHHASQLNTSSVRRRESDGSIAYGLFQISDQRWCSYKRHELRGCNLHCNRLRDGSIADDVECIKHIYKEHDALLGDGFMAWEVYLPYCHNQQNESVTQIAQCFDTNELKQNITKENSLESKNVTNKIYKYCELAHELYRKHDIPIEQIPIWLCIVQHESGSNTAAVARVNGAANHGLFQISDLYWCSHDRNGGKACNISCHNLIDSDISDDVRCVKTIYEEHTGISGDGFTAWVAYKPHCRDKNLQDINQCFNENELKGPLNLSTPTNESAMQTNLDTKSDTTGKIYSKCELAQELYRKHHIPMEQIPIWVCIVQHESGFNTSAIARLNADGSADHGLFHISDLYWCSHDRNGGKACNISCDNLIDSDISDDVRCIKTIYEEHTGISGDGFTAWVAYKPHCRDKNLEDINQCFNENELKILLNISTPTNESAMQTNLDTKSDTTGKIYSKCELAQELYRKHHIPMEQIPIWVCIVQHESGFNTSAIARLNADGSADHGLFHISDLYWCSHDRNGGKACNISCDNLIDSDISDDVRCVKTIYEEHTGISGDGFTAWVAYKPHCRDKNLEDINQCFNENELKGPINLSTPTNESAMQTNLDTKSDTTGKIYSKCELAQELYRKHHIPMEQIPIWVCIVQHESGFNTSAIARLNADGSADHGLFHISDLYWCSHDRNGGKACNISCDNLIDSDISDDVRCIKTIYEEHTGISGDGFTAWVAYKPHCRDKNLEDINQCFNENELMGPLNISTPTNESAMQTNLDTKSDTTGKIYSKCELAQELYRKHHIPMEQIPIWVCIVQHESGFNTSAIARLNADGSADHGLFQISDLYWCSHDRNAGKACNISCDNLIDSDISDDVRCVKTIYEEHTGISGDGFTAWVAYKPHCRDKNLEDINQCFNENELMGPLNISTPTNESAMQTNLDTKSDTTGKIYSKCELAQELYSKHHIPMEQIPIWVCIVQHESGFNTSAIARLNADGSADHGLFQISDLYWCSHDRNGGKACNISCDNLIDSDISDDVRCVRTIYEEHTGISGDGFTAWVAYKPHCRDKNLEDINQCFNENELKIPLNISTPTNESAMQTNLDTKSDTTGKIYSKCELAQELYSKHHIPMEQIPIWVCIVQHESGFNTSAIARLNADGSADHGLFQISDLYWCSHDRNGGKACNISCDNLIDSDISDDVRCVRTIYEEHTGISGDGFTAWVAYKPHCRDKNLEDINQCFNENELKIPLNISTPTNESTMQTNLDTKSDTTGKIYSKCELAQELYRKHHIPMEQIPIWVCIVQHESGFNTSAIARLNADGSADHGLFQISDLYWCSHDRNSGKACNISCDNLIDSDISDDVRCIKTIYEEHTGISGDGFTAWVAYKPHCRDKNLEDINQCFNENELKGPLNISTPTNESAMQTNLDTKSDTTGKIYSKCELAQELYRKHHIPMEQIPIWVCIVQHESGFNTSAIARLNADGSADHGLFQISDLYWCSHDRNGGKACNISCDNLIDSDISDDVRCVKTIYEEHTGISGDGFTAWVAYKPHCRDKNLEDINQCFNENELKIPLNISTPTNESAMQTNLDTKSDTTGKIYSKCELAQELYRKHHIPMEQIPIWVCIVQHESGFNTSAIARLNADGSADHGLFQISDLYWCSHDRNGGKACNISCDNLIDSDISDDVRCIKTIYEEHTGISGDGFTAWVAYKPHCRDKNLEDINQCFNENELKGPLNISTPTNESAMQTNLDTKSDTTGKIYSKCELAQELYRKHHIPMEQIPIWVCIVQHESGFNTSAIARLNADGSADHGLFQISDLYWCSHDRNGGKACNISCGDLIDSDISDDVRCIKTIYEEHTGISGDGFTAWVAYKPHCRDKNLEDINQCFNENELKVPLNISTPTNESAMQTNLDTKSDTTGKIYSKCELAQELYSKHHIPMEQIPIWVCIVQHESGFNTSAIARLNADGSADHGLFQISDLYWCSHDRNGGKACNISCDNLIDSDISDDVRCVKTIYEEHTGISGDGFTAWVAYKPHCRDKNLEDINQCFNENELKIPLNISTPTNESAMQTNLDTKSDTTGKIYSKCELAQELYRKHHIPMEQIPIWVCIVQHESGFNTSAIARLNADGSADHGLFQISDLYWCSHDRNGGKACNISCDNLIDSDISDDVRCVRTIYEEHTGISGDGFTAWVAYKPHCRDKNLEDINQCFNENELMGPLNISTPTNESTMQTNLDTKSDTTGKIYSKCELAQELYRKHHIPMEQIPIWVCIVQHESGFNTSAIARLNADGSADHGLFQISDLYWCSHDRNSGKACNISCDNLIDSDISDDVRCIKTIYEEHTGISGDGFTAWVAYKPHCRDKNLEDINQCFNENELKGPLNISTPTNESAMQTNLDTKSDTTGKIYSKCELAQELYRKHHIPMEQIPIWVCIVQHESGFNTSAIARLNADGSADHGLFQISDLYWCSHDRNGGKACNISCDNLIDSDISDDVRCIKTIYEEHTGISGDGFTAWVAYKPHCRDKNLEDINQCFNENELMGPLNISTPTNESTMQTNLDTKSDTTGKIYSKCELAQELYRKHHIPMEQIPIWVCIVQHESGFNTSAIARLNADGSADHGLFQISDLYWCSHDRNGGKACNISCDNLIDSDISDDVRCIKTIYEEHTGISGDGFTAWVAYKPHCRDKNLEDINQCFNENELKGPLNISTPTDESAMQTNLDTKSDTTGKIYSKCELAQELYRKHHIPMEQIPIWVCIVQHESGFNTSAIARLNADGSADHGLFHISDLYWCSHDRNGGKACNISCDNLIDSDISDDVRCIKTIYEEHTGISGDGFTAWVAYKPHCRDKNLEDINQCFNENELKIPLNISTPTNESAMQTNLDTKSDTTGKIYSKCELAQELYRKHHIPMEQIPIWVCIVQHESGFNTSAIARLNADGSADHGLFQISDLYWCSHDRNGGKACNISCDNLIDSDISDDVRCVKTIYEEHTGISGDGFTAWVAYKPHCRDKNLEDINQCFNENELKIPLNISTPTNESAMQTNLDTKSDTTGKIYSKCELAQELYRKHHIPMEQIPIWVCIVQHESGFNTSAIARLNADGSADHGLFQISDLYWCSHDRNGGKACNISCDNLIDSDISDDVRCVRTIYEEHTGISGDGFTAWVAYKPHCLDKNLEDINQCFNENELKIPLNISTPTNESTMQTNLDTKSDTTGKIYSKCELAQELYRKHHIPMEQIPIWVCIVQHESGFNTSAIARLNADGSADHGLFQISDLYWCSHDRNGGKACNISCGNLIDSDISDDVRCIKTIYEEHTGISGDGFTAWVAYKPHCRDKNLEDINQCFNENELMGPLNISTPTNESAMQTNLDTKSDTTGKIYSKCELAQELYRKHHIPMEQIPIWVCIVQHESGFNTSAVARLNADGSADHGLFQISDLYWCSHDRNGGKACNISCDNLIDSDISDDVRCVKTIYEEHTGISGDGFTAWVAYKPHCRDKNLEDINQCFNENELMGPLNISTPKNESAMQTNLDTKSDTTGKIYSKCELAQELYRKHHIPMEQIPIWVCIVQHESGFNTSAIARLNADGSADHGLFQISDLYWCSHDRNGGKACNISCDNLIDSDISDDVRCIKKIYEEHSRISGDGFTAWSVYKPHCLHRPLIGTRSCFSHQNADKIEIEINLSIRGTRIPELYEQIRASQNVSSNEAALYYETNLILNPSQEEPTSTIHSSNGYNQFVKGSFKLQLKKQDSQLYFSNPFLNDYFTNNNSEHNSMDSFSILSARPPVLAGNLNAITTLSPYDKNSFSKGPIKAQVKENNDQVYISNQFLIGNSTNNNSEHNSMDSLATLSTSPPVLYGNLSVITTPSPYDSNPFSKGPFKLQVKGNDNPVYISNRFLNDNSTNNNPEHNSIDSLSTLSTSAPVLLGNLSAITTVSPYDNNLFLKGTIKLPAKENDNQMYLSNPLANDNSTNNNREHTLIDSLSILSTSAPVLRGNLSAITTVSPYDNNPFLKGPIKLPAKENDNQMYLSNPFVNDNSTNNNPEHTSMGSISTLSTSAPVLRGNMSSITTVSPYDNNPFLKGTIKLQAKGNDNQVYISNRFLNDNSTNNNPEHTSIDSLSTLSTSAPVLLGNVSAITTVSPYDNNPFLKGTIKLPAKENDNQMYLSNPLANDNSTNNNREHTLIDSLSILSTSAPVLRGNLSAITTVSPYDNNPFLKGPIKLPAKENDNQMYLSNPFVNDNSTNNNPEHTSMGSISTLSTSAPVLLGNLTTIITVSPYDNNPFLKRTIKLQAEENNNQMYISNPLLNGNSEINKSVDNSTHSYEVAQWVCIAQEASGLNSDLRSLDSHGLFQINERFWCSPPGSGCNIECDKLRDDHITDDLACVKIIHAEHQRISGDGYTAWPVYQHSCQNQSFAYIENCFGNQLTSQHHGYSTKNYSRNEKSKVYGRCELARALYKEHSIPIEQVATWICIAHHESHFNTSAYGLFQISNLHWCSYKRYGLNRLIDENIADDVECIKRIYKEHAALFGDGFTAWTASLPYCRNQHYEHIASCFEGEKIDDISYKHSASSLHPQYVDNPFFKQKMARISGNDVFQVKKKDIVLETKVYEQCSLAQELYFKHNIPIHDVATWICIALHASHFDTSKIGPIGDDDSKSYGLFQINDRYWCSRYSYDGKGCNIPCTNLLDSDISDDIRCIKLIQKEHERISGVGFDAWTHYKSHCQNENVTQIAKCFNKDELKKDIPKNNGLESKTITNKIYKYCELAQELYHRHHIPMEQIPTWVCIAQHESSFNTAAIGRLNTDGSADHGLFQISDLYWCSHDRYGTKACGIPCDNLLDSDIADDIRCVRTIYEEHTRLSGNGFTAWTVYQPHCRNKRVEHINQCFNESELRETLNIGPSTNKNSIKTNLDTKSHKKGKIYNKCELAQELYHRHHIPMEQIPTWVCIAQHESSFNTAALGRLNADGSADHGLFQISDLYWCSHDRYGSKACGIPCDNLLDSDIADDIRCVRTIYEEHTRLSGNGFTAWTVYQPHCRNKRVEHINQCFNESELRETLNIGPSTNKNSIKTNLDTKSHKKGKIYNKCELAQELYRRHHIPMEQIATWVCIAQHESSFNTAAIGRLNTDGSADHGLFQISDLYWCSHDRYGTKACGIPCDNLLDSDIADDIRCVRTIYEEHTRLSGNGFTAWTVYQPHCRNKRVEHINQCFNESELRETLNIGPSTNKNSIKTNLDTKSHKKGKIYNKCELAQELYHRHHIPMEQIATWVCIAQRESSFNTAAIGRLNADGSADHGLFQISDLYWCSHGRKGGKACSIPCDKLLDADISDDVRCIKIIYDQHTRISGDGFTAWTVYKPYCRERAVHETVSCFPSPKVDKIEKSSHSMNDVRKPKLYEQFGASQDVNIKNLGSSYKSNLFLNGFQKKDKNPTITTVASYDYNPFVNGSIKLQVEDNDSQMYVSNPFLNNNSKNNKLGHTSKDSSTKSPFYPHYTFSNVPTEKTQTLTTFSSTNKPALTWNSSTTPISRHLILNTIKPNLTNINKLTTGIRKIAVPVIITQAQPIKKTTIWQNEKKDSLQNVDIYEPLPKINRFVTSTSKIPSITARTTILTKYTNTVIPTITTKQPITKQSTSKAWNFMESEKKSKTIIVNTNRTFNTQGKARERTTSSINKTCSGILDCSETTAEKPPTHKPTPKNVTSSVKAVKCSIVTTKKPQSAWSTSKQPNTLGHITGRRVSSATNNRTTQNPIKKSIKSNKLLLSYDWASYIKALNITSAIVTTKQPFITRTSHSSHDRQVNTIKLSKTIKERTTTTKSPTKAKTLYSTSTTKPNLSATTPSTDPFDHPFFARFKEQFKKNNVPR
ncbi:uncharacterized protein ACN2A1_004661 [Glossina fuscipes fuscipes]